MLGLRTFAQFAEESRVRDSRAFEECVDDAALVPAVERDIAAARAIRAFGTPAVVVNGWHLRGGINGDRLDSAVVALLSAQSRQQ
jgi:protein-disulfide isomerase